MIINLAKIRFGGSGNTGGGTPAKPEDSFQETYTANGAYDITPEEGHVFSGGHVEVDVHPTDKLTRTYTENNTYEISGEWTNAEITVAVPGPVEETFDITPTNSDITVVPTVADNVFSGGVVRGYDVDPIYNALEDLNTGDPVSPVTPFVVPEGMSFAGSTVTSIPASWDWSQRTNLDLMFSNCTSLTDVPALNTTNATDMNGMFDGCTSLTSVPVLDMTNCNSASNMFSNCTSLTDISKLDISRVSNILSMFSGCTSLTDASSLDLSNAVNLSSLFSGCTSLTSLPEFNLPKATDISYMLSGISFEIAPKINAPGATSMNSLFANCTNLTTAEIDIPAGADISYMFDGCTSLTSIPTLNPLENASNIAGLFNGCTGLTEIPELNTSGATNMDYIFAGCTNLTSIAGIDFSGCYNEYEVIHIYPFGEGEELNNLTHCIVKGKLRTSIHFEQTPHLDYDSIYSILTAANVPAKPDPITKILTFNQSITDQNSTLSKLVTSCQRRGWTVEGLTIN